MHVAALKHAVFIFVPLSVSPGGPHAPTTSVRSITTEYFIGASFDISTSYNYDQALAVCKRNNGNLLHSWGQSERTSDDALPRETLNTLPSLPLHFWTRNCLFGDPARCALGVVTRTDTAYGYEGRRQESSAMLVLCERGELKLVTSILCSS